MAEPDYQNMTHEEWCALVAAQNGSRRKIAPWETWQAVRRGFSLWPFARSQGREAEYIAAFLRAAFVDAAAGILTAGTGNIDSQGADSDNPDDLPAPPPQPDGDPITEDWLMYLEDTGQTGLLEEAAKTNHLCVAGRG